MATQIVCNNCGSVIPDEAKRFVFAPPSVIQEGRTRRPSDSSEIDVCENCTKGDSAGIGSKLIARTAVLHD
jgi:hypothetical protein